MNSIIISENEKLKKVMQKVCLCNIKSNFILKKIFGYIKKSQFLEFIKYNKKLQKRLNLSIMNYKEYSSKIIIESKLFYNRYGKFINISDKEKKYYHIYFDDSNEEIKSNYIKKKMKAKAIKILIFYNINSLKELFADCRCISSIFFKKFCKNNIINMSFMFSDCSSLKELNLSNFNTDNITNMKNAHH